ncbi:MAG: AAA family ATPase [Acidobacteria bacterium]|nr:AAA family ATPase [Acidobacteriota bacterium]
MPRRPRQEIEDAELRAVIERLGEVGPDGPSLHEQFALIARARERTPDAAATIDRWLLFEMGELRDGLAEARRHQEELKKVHAQLTSPPWYAAVFLRPVDGTMDRAIVSYQGTPRVVALAEGLTLDSLSAGEDVLLAHDLNIVLRRLTPSITRACEVAEFQYALDDGRLVLKSRETEVIASGASTLAGITLRAGDRLRWDPTLAMAFEQLPRSSDSNLFLTETPSESFDDIGGLDRQIERLQRSVRLHVRHPEVVERYKLRRATSVLLVGPPGTGKTMVARALARWLGEESPEGRSRFMHIKPGALHSMWYSQSESNYRDAFRVAREAGASDPGVPVVLFFDEVDAIGLTRSDGLARIDDRVLTSFMAELDGLEPRGNVLVVAATNRRDALDPALLRPGRLGDLVLDIPRPSMAAARAILERYLPPSIPYGRDGRDSESRRDVIDGAVSRIYAPNGEGEVGWITFRDGTRRAIQARELVSGAMLANIARNATERACVRELETGAVGIQPEDVLDAAADAVATAVTALTPQNCHAHMAGLPQDLTVTRIELTSSKARRPHRFLSTA